MRARLEPVAGVALAACLVISAIAQAASTPESCAAGDIANAVRGGDMCLALETVRGSASRDSGSPLYVVVHGDVSRGGAADYHYRIAREIAAAYPDAVAVAVLRRGYFDSAGKRSDGHDGGRGDSYTAENIDSMAAAIGALRAHYRPVRMVLIGHSGGSAYSGVIVGRHPGLVDGVVLVSCPCDLQRARDSAGKRSNGRSLSPSSFADQVPQTARVIAITGRRDTNTFSWIARDYIEGLARRGIAAEFREVASSGHDMDRSLRAAILDAVKAFQASPSAAP
jgi:pimeloyl-ACP methyl ester carboxylesterase